MFHLIRVNRNRGTCEYEKSRVVPMVGFKADGIPQFGSELPYPCFSGKYNDFIFIFPQLAIFRFLSWLFFVSSVGYFLFPQLAKTQLMMKTPGI